MLPPVDISAWTTESLDEQVTEVRAMFAATLDRWPGRPAPPPDPAAPLDG